MIVNASVAHWVVEAFFLWEYLAIITYLYIFVRNKLKESDNYNKQ